MQVHAEHGEAVARAQQQVFDSGITGPEGHAISQPAVLEVWRGVTHPVDSRSTCCMTFDVKPVTCQVVVKQCWSTLTGSWIWSCQAEATARAIRLAKFIGVPLYVVHVMAAEALEEVGFWLRAITPLMWPN